MRSPKDNRSRRNSQASVYSRTQSRVSFEGPMGRRPSRVSVGGGDPSARKGRRGSQAAPRRGSLGSEGSMISATWYNAGQGLEEDNLVQSKQQQLQRRSSRASNVHHRAAPVQRHSEPMDAGYRSRVLSASAAPVAANQPATKCPVPRIQMPSSSAPDLHAQQVSGWEEVGGIEGVLQGLKEEILQAQKAMLREMSPCVRVDLRLSHSFLRRSIPYGSAT
eukprot:6026421-Amphidinium_carterae.1